MNFGSLTGPELPFMLATGYSDYVKFGVLGLVGLVVFLVLAFLVFMVIVCLVEKQYLVGDVEPASGPFPYSPSSYWKITRENARRLDLQPAGDFATRKNTSLVKGAEVSVGAIVAGVAAVADIRSAIGFSSFAVLTYYAIANVAAWTLEPEQRRWPRPLTVLGLCGCIALAITLPWKSALGGAVVLGAGALYYVLRGAWRRRGARRR